MCEGVSVHVCVRVGMHSLGFADMENTSVVHATSSTITHSVESDKVVQCKCSAQSRNLRNLRIPKLRANLEIAQQS